MIEPVASKMVSCLGRNGLSLTRAFFFFFRGISMHGIFFKVGKVQLGKSKRWLTICRGMGSGKAWCGRLYETRAGRQATELRKCPEADRFRLRR